MTMAEQWREALGGLVAPGEIIAGKYRLDRIVGVGGMGVVIEGHHLELDRKVAVKVLRPERLVKDSSRERFKREARACFSMTSEHVTRIIDLGSLEGGGLYMVMELLEGRDFAHLLLERGQLPPETAVAYVLQVCEAVAEAHALGTVHRDLKPDNLFLCQRADGSPCVKVLDFGLAKVAEPEQPSLTRVNRGMGTPRYMSPEQWVSARDVGPPADIYALGVILFELITGQCPFDAADVNALCQKVLFTPAPTADTLVKELPPGLSAVIARCLEKKPQLRYQSIADLVAALLPYAPRYVGQSVPQDPAVPQAAPGWALTLSERDVIEVKVPVTATDAVEVVSHTADHDPPATIPDEDDAWVEQPTVQQPRPQPKSGRGWWLAASALLIAGALALASMSGAFSNAASDSSAPAAQPPNAPPQTTPPAAPPPAPPAASEAATTTSRAPDPPAPPDAAVAAPRPTPPPAPVGQGGAGEAPAEPTPVAIPTPRPRPPLPRRKPPPKPTPAPSTWVPDGP